MNYQDPWAVVETELDPAELHYKETLFTLGNGYLGTRGTFEEGYPGSWPATLMHGVYDDVPTYYSELANCPDWLPLFISLEGERFGMDRGKVLRYERRLDLRGGVLSRNLRWRSPAGRTVDLRFERFASLHDPHIVAIRCQITPIDFGGLVEVQAGLNGYPENWGWLHWEWLDQGSAEGMVWLHERTRATGIELGMASRLIVRSGEPAPVETMSCRGFPTLAARFRGVSGQTVTVDKLVTIYTLRDTPWPVRTALAKLSGVGEYDALRAAHEAVWAETWRASDVEIMGDARAQLAVRYNLFQLLIAAPWHDERSSIPAKALSGLGYRGHVFWDTEIFIVPFLAYTQPKLAKNLLMYRYHTLPGARRKAQAGGYEGAQFAWESALTGDEVTPRWLPGPQGEELVRIWSGDIQLHISSDIAYTVWHYWHVTGDDAWMREYGAEIVLDTAVFWGSRVEWNPERQVYEIRDVNGPDEYHDHVNNNTFTNAMVQWHLKTALDVLTWVRESDPARADDLESRLNLTPERLKRWTDIIDRLVILRDPKSGLIEQFEGFFALKDVDLAAYEPRTQSLHSVMGIAGTNAHQVLKQPDALMLLYLLSEACDRETLQINWDYYAPRTDHSYGSSLGPAIHAILASRLGRSEEAYSHFMQAALADLEDVRGNAAHGIHAASAGGVWQAIVFGFGGVRLDGNGLAAEPHLPPSWSGLKFRLQFRGRWFDFDLAPPSAKDQEGKSVRQTQTMKERSDARNPE